VRARDTTFLSFDVNKTNKINLLINLLELSDNNKNMTLLLTRLKLQFCDLIFSRLATLKLKTLKK